MATMMVEMFTQFHSFVDNCAYESKDRLLSQNKLNSKIKLWNWVNISIIMSCHQSNLLHQDLSIFINWTTIFLGSSWVILESS